MNTPTVEVGIVRMLARNPALPNLLSTLHQHAIHYGLYAGSYVAIMTGAAGDFKDIDLLIADDDMVKVRKLFPEGSFKDKPYAQFFFPEISQTVECMARATVTVPDHTYNFRLTDLAYTHVTDQMVENVHIHMLDPADTILLKLMILQKEDIAPDRHDLQDVKALMAHVEIDRMYLIDRIQESDAKTPSTLSLLRQLDIA